MHSQTANGRERTRIEGSTRGRRLVRLEAQIYTSASTRSDEEKKLCEHLLANYLRSFVVFDSFLRSLRYFLTGIALATSVAANLSFFRGSFGH
jgi:hypothetical protein